MKNGYRVADSEWSNRPSPRGSPLGGDEVLRQQVGGSVVLVPKWPILGSRSSNTWDQFRGRLHEDRPSRHTEPRRRSSSEVLSGHEHVHLLHQRKADFNALRGLFTESVLMRRRFQSSQSANTSPESGNLRR